MKRILGYTIIAVIFFSLLFYFCESLNNPVDPAAQSYIGYKAKAIAGNDTVVSINDTILLWGRNTYPQAVIAKYLWDFNGDGSFEWESPDSGTVRHAYPDSGNYNAVFACEDPAGNLSYATVSVVVKQDIPVFYGPDTLYAGINDPFVLNVNAVDSLGEIISTEWDFNNDGVNDATRMGKVDVIWSFAQAGAHAIRERVTDDDGNSIIRLLTVIVQTNPPVIESISDIYAGVNDSFTITNIASDTDVTITRYEWDINRDGQFEKSTVTDSIRTAFSDTGTHTVFVRVTDDDGNKTIGIIRVIVQNHPPSVIFTASATSVSIKDTVIFNVAGSDSDGHIIGYEWDFNNDMKYETITTDTVLKHAWPDTGMHIAGVRSVDDDSLRSARTTVTIHVLLDLPIVDAGNDTTVMIGDTVVLTGTARDSFGSIKMYYWYTNGDGVFDDSSTTSTAVTITATSFPDTFNAIFKVRDDDGLIKSDTLIVRIIRVYSTATKWIKQYSYPDLWCSVFDVRQIGNGDILVAGSVIIDFPCKQAFFLKTSSGGDSISSVMCQYVSPVCSHGWIDDAFFTDDSSAIFSGSTDYYDHWSEFAKVNYNGTIIGFLSYSDILHAHLTQLSDGSYLITGNDLPQGGDSYSKIFLAKLAVGGNNILWAKVYGDDTTENHIGQAIQTNDGGYALTGGINSLSLPSTTSPWLYKFDANGNKIWAKTYMLNGNSSGSYLFQTADGGYVIGGTINGQSLLIRTDANGDTIWTRNYGNSSGIYLFQMADGGYVIGGTNNGQNLLIWTDANGNTLWTRNFGSDRGIYFHENDDGGLTIVGIGSVGGIASPFFLKTDASGNVTWTNRFTVNGLSSLVSVSPVNDGGYLLLGITSWDYDASSIVYLIRTDSLGNTE